MKILHIINSLHSGGAEKLLLDTIPLYNKTDLEVDILLLNGEACPFLKLLKKKKCCRIYSLGVGSVYNPALIFKIIPYLQKYDLTHVHLFPALYYVGFAKLITFSKVKLIFTEHNTSNRRLANPFFKILDRNIYKMYEKVVCISKEIQEIVHKHSKKDISFLPIIENGVNLAKINNAKEIKRSEISENLLSSDILIIQVAGFREQKDQKTAIKALFYLKKDVKLLFVGEGLLKKECESLVKSMNLEDRVFFLGERTDVPQLLKSSDIILLSTKHEGLSLSSIEGMASGRPFVASRVPGIIDVVDCAGVLFPKGNEKSLATNIDRLLNDDNYYKEIVEKCQKRAENYDISKMIVSHIGLYNSILKKEI
jgi:glycosyltransferase involved in cell wall biosynthesis